MSYAIELYFDSASEARVHALWADVAALGASSMIESDSRPHVSLAVAESLEVGPAISFLDQFASATRAFPVTLASIGIFPAAEPVLFLAPKVTPQLLQLHSDFLARFAPLANDIWPYYLPAAWVPHCTISMGVRPEDLGTAYNACKAVVRPLEVRVLGISLIEFRPVRKLHSAAFPV